MRELFKEELSQDLFVSSNLGNGEAQIVLAFKIVPQLEKLEAKIAGKSGIGYKLAGYAIDFAKAYIAKQETPA